jgi:hypothetical protein
MKTYRDLTLNAYLDLLTPKERARFHRDTFLSLVIILGIVFIIAYGIASLMISLV